MIHVSGVGLLGSFVLHAAHRRGLRFTWDDTETIFNAWRASTGAVIPCEDEDQELYAQGYRKWRDDATKRPELQQFLEPVETLYVMKNPPARVFRKWKPEVVGENRVWRETLPGWQFDADGFVKATREQFKDRRSMASPASAIFSGRWIRCRGVQERMDTGPITVWGWRVPVKIKPKQGGQIWASGEIRPVIHFNDPDRPFERYYFHPRANDPETWWAGSEAVLQKTPAPMMARAAQGFKNYLETVEKRFGEHLEVFVLGGITEGWRAKPKRVHKALYGAATHCREASPGVFVATPLYKSGVQCGPLYADTILDRVLRGIR